MEMYAAHDPAGYDFPISTLFWGALVFVALFVCCFFAWKAIEWLRTRGKVRSEVAEGRVPKVPKVPKVPGDPSESWATQAISRPSGDRHYWEMGSSGGLGVPEYMSQREQEEFFSTYAPRKVRKAMRASWKAREQAQKQQNKP